MAFVIDTGVPAFSAPNVDKLQVLRDAAADMLPPDADQSEIDAAVARMIVLDLNKPKRADTVRAHFRTLWPLVAEMADRSPASHDFIITEYAERLSEFC